MPQFGASLTVVNYTPGVVSYAPNILIILATTFQFLFNLQIIILHERSERSERSEVKRYQKQA